MAMAPEVQSPAAVTAPPPAEATLYVGDLDPSVIESDLLRCFAGFGPIHSVRVIRDRVSGGSLRYAYLNFLDRAHAAEALKAMNHQQLMGRRPMRIMWSLRGPRDSGGAGNLFVKNLEQSVGGADLERVFGEHGLIVSCKVELDEEGRSRGFGFVQMDTEESVKNAIERLHGKRIEGFSYNLYVSNFVKKSQRQTQADNGQECTNLYIKNLEREITDGSLREKFAEFGNVCSAVIMKDDLGKSKGFGFVSFELPEQAQKAMNAMNGSVLGSTTIYVGPAQKKAEREKLLKARFCAKQDCPNDTACVQESNVYVRFLDQSVDDSALRQHFMRCGRVVSARVMLQQNGMSRGFGFVRFSSPEEAKKAAGTLHGTEFRGKSLYVAIAQRKEEREKAQQAQRAVKSSAYYAQLYDQTLCFQGFHYVPQIQRSYRQQQAIGAGYQSAAFAAAAAASSRCAAPAAAYPVQSSSRYRMNYGGRVLAAPKVSALRQKHVVVLPKASVKSNANVMGSKKVETSSPQLREVVKEVAAKVNVVKGEKAVVGTADEGSEGGGNTDVSGLVAEVGPVAAATDADEAEGEGGDDIYGNSAMTVNFAAAAAASPAVCIAAN